eukprot:scaffold2989_cov184-Amphora_coffeaeformis.AAC.7
MAPQQIFARGQEGGATRTSDSSSSLPSEAPGRPVQADRTSLAATRNSSAGGVLDGRHDSIDNKSVFTEMRRSRGSSGYMSVLTPQDLSTTTTTLTALAPSERLSNSLADFTINKLKFDKLGLYGRETEKELLRQALQDMMILGNQQKETEQQEATSTANMNLASSSSGCRQKQLVLISGSSGVGKSALAKDLLRNKSLLRRNWSSSANAGDGGTMMRGKFNLNIHEPYHGIAAACTDMASQLLASSWSSGGKDRTPYPTTTRLIQIQEAIRHEKDLSILTQVIPVLTEIFPVDANVREETTATTETTKNPHHGSDTTSSMTHTVHNSTETKNRFHQAFRRFIRILASHFVPLVFVLDDLQWADVPSLELMENILMDRSNNNLMLIGIYRSNEIDERHILTQTLNELRSRSLSNDKSTFTMREMELGNLNLDAIHSFIMDVLSTNDIKTLGLAEICQRRTHGNPFFLVHFLRELHRLCLLEFNFGTMQWTWNEAEIEGQMQATDNVVDLLRSKLSQIPANQRKVLEVASFLGASFHRDVLLLIWLDLHAESERDSEQRNMITALDALEEEGYFQHPSDCEYKFTHDKIQETASSLVPENQRGDLAHAIGTTLSRNLDVDKFDSSVFVAAQLLNIGKIPELESERIELARFNLKACRKAVSISAFEAATNFAAKGIKLLGTDGWKDNYELMIELHTIGTETESYVGNVERMEQYYNCILAQKDRPSADKLRAHYVYLGSIAYRGRADEAAKLAFDLLKSFGHTFPKTKAGIVLQTVWKVFKVKKMLKGNGLNQLNFLPMENDPTRLLLLLILDRLVRFVYISDDPSLLPLVIFRTLEWTRRYGVNQFSASALAQTGIIFTGVLNDLSGGASLASAGLELSKKKPELPTEVRSVYLAHGLVLCWSYPWRNQLKPLLKAYDIGLRIGDSESACWAILHYIIFRFLSGTGLDLLVADTRVYHAQCEELQHIYIGIQVAAYSQVFINLMGDTDDNLALSGDILSESELKSWRERDRAFAGVHNTLQCYLYTMYGEHLLCAQLALRHGVSAIIKQLPASPIGYIEIYSKGVSCFAAARETGRRRYLKLGRQAHKVIKRWIEQGCPNVSYYDALLEAEYAACQGRKFLARQKYDIAIVISARGGLLLDAGFAAERLGEYLLEIGEPNDDALFQLKRAAQYYEEIGAHGKASQLLRKHSGLVSLPDQIVAPRVEPRERT